MFEDEAGKMNRSVRDVGGAVLIISNFTLHGDCRKGRRPSFDDAAGSQLAEQLYKEVVELGPYKNEDFIKREFHMDLDSDENNSEEHVVFLIQGAGEKEKMIIQVTYFEAKRTRIIKYAKDIKTILCHVKGDKIEIKKCDYSEDDIKSLFPDILQGIRNKKKFLKLIDRKDKL